MTTRRRLFASLQGRRGQHSEYWPAILSILLYLLFGRTLIFPSDLCALILSTSHTPTSTAHPASTSLATFRRQSRSLRIS